MQIGQRKEATSCLKSLNGIKDLLKYFALTEINTLSL